MSANSLKPLAGQWLRKAQDDELAINAILKEKVSFATVCFLSQQLAEKCIKAYLAENNKKILKIHQLERLLGICAEISPDFKNLGEEAVLLSEYYIETRYPGDIPEGLAETEAKEAQAAALKIKKFIYKKLDL